MAVRERLERTPEPCVRHPLTAEDRSRVAHADLGTRGQLPSREARQPGQDVRPEDRTVPLLSLPGRGRAVLLGNATPASRVCFLRQTGALASCPAPLEALTPAATSRATPSARSVGRQESQTRRPPPTRSPQWAHARADGLGSRAVAGSRRAWPAGRPADRFAPVSGVGCRSAAVWAPRDEQRGHPLRHCSDEGTPVQHRGGQLVRQGLEDAADPLPRLDEVGRPKCSIGEDPQREPVDDRPDWLDHVEGQAVAGLEVSVEHARARVEADRQGRRVGPRPRGWSRGNSGLRSRG